MGFKDFINASLNKPLPEDITEFFNLKSRVSGYILTKAQQNSPTCGYNYEADITKFWDAFQELKNTCGYELSFNTLMMKVLVEGLKAAPKLNSHIDFNTTSSCGTLIMKKHIDIAMPVLMKNGETFPVKVKETEMLHTRPCFIPRFSFLPWVLSKIATMRSGTKKARSILQQKRLCP